MSGWYKQQRDACDRPWAKDPQTVSVYFYLHCHAYVQDQLLRGSIIRRGSCPTSRAAIMEGTGLSDYAVKKGLKNLLAAGEIIVKTSSLGTIVTLCDYDCYDGQTDLFGHNFANESPSQSPNESPSESPTYIEGRRKKEEDKLRSNSVTSKQEREREDEAYEIKKLYNKTFDGVLPEWKRLTKDMVMKIRTCIGRYGRQSVDMVFEQIRREPFSLGENKTGFIANHSFIFDIRNYEGYLGRYELRMKKGEKGAAETQQHTERTEAKQQKKSNGSWIDAYNENNDWRPEDKR